MRVSSKKTTQNSFKSYKYGVLDDGQVSRWDSKPKLYRIIYGAGKLSCVIKSFVKLNKRQEAASAANPFPKKSG